MVRHAGAALIALAAWALAVDVLAIRRASTAETVPSAQAERRPIGEVDFFGYKGLDVDRIRAVLPFHDGDLFPPEHSSWDALRTEVRDAVDSVIGQKPTDVAFVCCDRGNWMIYIGLPGASSRMVRYNPAPTQDVVLPPEILRMNEEMKKALMAAVMRGNTGENDSRGYALSVDPDARAREFAVRDYALRHELILLHVLEESSNAEHRAVAAEALGYARFSKRQISALVDACLDPDDSVRNNAVRALGVLAGAKRAAARAIPADLFIQLLGSGTWTDHNKAVMVLEALSTRRTRRF
jgi:hypothetical protein